MSALAKLPAYPMHVSNLTASPILEYLTVSEIIIRIFSGLKKILMKRKCPFLVVKKETKSLSDLGVTGLIWSMATNLHSHDGIVAGRASVMYQLYSAIQATAMKALFLLLHDVTFLWLVSWSDPMWRENGMVIVRNINRHFIMFSFCSADS